MHDGTMPDKRMDLTEAIRRFVHDGDTVYVGGFIQQDPCAAIHEIIRQGMRDLTISKAAGLLSIDMLIGAGCIRKVITSYVWNPIPRPAHAFVRAIREGIPRPIELEEVSLLTLNLAYLAGALGLPFIPTNTLLGSDMVRPQARLGGKELLISPSPGTGEPCCIIPPLTHDVGIIQVQRSDPCGNAQAWGFRGESKYGILSCRKIIVCAEEVVPTEVVQRDPDRTIVPSFRTTAVVEVPWGAHPSYTMGYYDVDWQFFHYYERETRTVEGFLRFLKEWVFDTADRRAYMEKIGQERMHALRGQRWDSGSVSYGLFPDHAWAKDQ